eukprot:3646-Heterococcus_DN1.PRE.2
MNSNSISNSHYLAALQQRQESQCMCYVLYSSKYLVRPSSLQQYVTLNLPSVLPCIKCAAALLSHEDSTSSTHELGRYARYCRYQNTARYTPYYS